MAVRATSIKTYNEIKASGLLSRQLQNTYDVVFKHGPMTSNQIDIHLRQAGLLPHRSAQPTVTRLLELGVLCEVCKADCPVTGRLVAWWDVTACLPQKPQKTSLVTLKLSLDSALMIRRALADEGEMPDELGALDAAIDRYLKRKR